MAMFVGFKSVVGVKPPLTSPYWLQACI